MYHFSGGVNDVHFLEDSSTIVCDESFSSSISDHFVHTSGTETGSDTVRHGFGGLDVCGADIFSFLVFIVLGLLSLLWGLSHFVLRYFYINLNIFKFCFNFLLFT